MMAASIEAMTSELHKAFALLNNRFFENQIPAPAITIQTSGHKKLSMGWCTTKEVWGDKDGKIKLYEINISAEYVDLNFVETMDTLMHEMVHLYNIVHKVQDCSRNNTYHNKNFKARAIQSGFYFPDKKPNKKYGWAFPKLTKETIEEIQKMDIDQAVFTISRRGSRYFDSLEEMEEATSEESGEEKKKKSFKWVCPGCALIVRSTKRDIHLKCGECDMSLVTED
jgi:hypothetical protein